MTQALDIIHAEHATMWRVLALLDHLHQELQQPGQEPDIELLQMIFDYFSGYSERMHHPKEEQYLFATLRRRHEHSATLIDELEQEHCHGRELVEQLRQRLAEMREHYPHGRDSFMALLADYIAMARQHINHEEQDLVPLARQHLTTVDWETINHAFSDNRDPLFGEQTQHEFRELHRRLTHFAPAPYGVADRHPSSIHVATEPEPTPKPASAVPLLQVEALTSHYGRIQALRGINLQVYEGQLVALVGANGAGKTTLLRTISGLQPVSSGRILLRGNDISRVRADLRVRMGISQSPEGRQVFGPLSIEDNLRLGAFTRASDKQGIADDLERIYQLFPILREKRRLPAGTLSGGQQQMLAMGRALMARPKLLLLDEPSMGLAPLVVEEIFSVITDLKAQGMTIFLVEQNAHAALSIADTGYVIEIGETVLSDHGPALLQNQRVKAAYLGL